MYKSLPHSETKEKKKDMISALKDFTSLEKFKYCLSIIQLARSTLAVTQSDRGHGQITPQSRPVTQLPQVL